MDIGPILQPVVPFGQQLRVTTLPVTFGSVKHSARVRKAFAERLVEICNDMQLPERGRQTALAKQFGVSQQAVRKWLDGESYPETDKIIAMADWAEVNVNWLMQGVGLKHGNRVETKVLVLDEVLRSLPAEERREAIGFIRFKLERTRALFTSEKLARYEKALENFEPPDDKPPQ